MLADLHTHTLASDGTLSPEQLVSHAVKAGVTMLSITDHDTVAAYRQFEKPHPEGIQLIPGIEFSSRWRNIGIHILGLNIDPDADSLLENVDRQISARHQRAEQIAAKLHKLGFHDTLNGAKQCAGDAAIGRPHFARYLTESGQVKDEQQAFKKFLGQGKSCDIRAVWPTPETLIESIRDAGGTAVLAHPAKYKLTNLRLEELAKDFLAAGGQGIETVSGKQPAALTDRLSRLANRHGLLASCGSDFHRPGQPWAALGAHNPLPASARPVWETW